MKSKEEKRRNIKKFMIGLLLGFSVSIGVGYAATVAGSSTTYDKNNSGLSSTNVQAAIDELYTKAKNSKVNADIVNAYVYDKTNCTTGNETGCQTTTCYKNKTANSCLPGTIIDYKVNNNTQVRFHVVHDDGTIITLQSQKNTLNNTMWYTSDNSKYGPTTALSALESATSNWTNVNDQTYTIGSYSDTLGSSECSIYKSSSYFTTETQYSIGCYSGYKLTRKQVKARMITVQEAQKVGCEYNSTSSCKTSSCPIWMYNYLNGSTSCRGTVNDSSAGSRYWTMTSADDFMGVTSLYNAWYVESQGGLSAFHLDYKYGIRAVVEISK